jgi:hypothetical protein
MAAIKFDELFQRLEQNIKDVEAAMVSLKSTTKDVEGLKGVRKQVEGIAKSRKKLTEIERDNLAIRKKAATLNKRAIREADRETQALDLKLQTKRQLLNLQKKEVTEQAKLNAELKRYRNLEVKSLSDLKKKQTVLKKYALTLDRAGKEYKQLTKEIRKNDAQLKKHNKSINSSRSGFNKLAGRAAGFVGIYGVIRLLGNLGKIFSQFEKANKRLQAILGVSAKDMSALKNQAKELGAITAFTASQVTGLQTELAKLGFTLPQIEASTEGILALAAATGTDLAEAATLSGAAVRIFGLSAEETARVADVLALSTSKSALDMQKLATALPIVGTTAKQAGLNIEQTTGLLGTLADRGIDASTAATSLRMIFIQLAKQGITFNEAMQKINDSTNKTKTAVELFGARAATAATVLSETGDATAKLTEELNNAKGAAQEMADVMLDNLSGDITKAKSAWEGFVLSIESGDGIISVALRNIIQSVTFLLQKLGELNKFGNIIGETDAKIIQLNIEKFKSEAQYLTEAQKIRKLKLKLLFLEEKILQAEEEKNKLPKSFLGVKTKEFKLINARIKAYKREKEILVDLNETGFFTGKENIEILEEETKAIDNNTEALKKNLSEREKFNKLVETTIESQRIGGIGGPKLPAIIGTDPNNRIISDDPKLPSGGRTSERVLQSAKSTTKTIKEKFDAYLKQLFDKDSDKSLLSRLLGGGDNSEAIAAQLIQNYQNLINIIGESIDNELNRIERLIAKQDEQIQKTQDQLEAEKDRLNELKAAGAAFDTTEKQRLEKKLRLEEAARQKSFEAEKKAKQKQKRLTLVQAIINTASATLKAFESAKNPIVGAILAAIAAAFGAAQIGVISSQKFAGGTDSVQLNGSPKGVDTVHAKLTEGEMVVQKNIVDQLPKGFTRFMLPEAANLYMNRKAPIYVNDNRESVKYLKNIDYNTKQKKGLNPDGSTAWEKKGNSTIYYN